jgi:cystathionine beta-lyase
MTVYNFDEIIDRTQHSSAKWTLYDPEYLPMWVADMDFRSPPSAIEAMEERIKHGVFGYTMDPPKLKDAIVERMKTLYNWDITPEDVLFSPGMVTALNAIAKGFGKDGDGILLQTPVYGPFYTATSNNRKFTHHTPMDYVDNGDSTFHYEADYDAFDRAARHKQVSIHYNCNPHNPGGFTYTQADLERIAASCIENDVLIVADEIHSDLILEGKHTPIASLSEEVAQNTLTMIAPSKTFNLPGMGCSILIAQNPDIRETISQTLRGMGVHVNILGYEAAYGAYTGGHDWLNQLRAYLKDNRDFALEFIRTNMPKIKTTVPNATYLLWMDMRDLGIENVADFCKNEAKLIFNPGEFFGEDGSGFVRLNFGCPRATLEEGLNRLKTALDNHENA